MPPRLELEGPQPSGSRDHLGFPVPQWKPRLRRSCLGMTWKIPKVASYPQALVCARLSPKPLEVPSFQAGSGMLEAGPCSNLGCPPVLWSWTGQSPGHTARPLLPRACQAGAVPA